MKLNKKRKVAQTKIDAAKMYSLEEASKLMKDINCTKFDSSVDIHVRLGVDPKKQIRPLEVLYPYHMEPVKPKKCWYFVLLTRKRKLLLPVLILWVWMNT